MLWEVCCTLLTAAAIAAYETPRMWRKRRWTELALFSVCLAFSTTLMTLLWLNVSLPSPLHWIDRMVQTAGLTV